MGLNDSLAEALSKILNAEKVGKSSCEVTGSKMLKIVLEIMKDNMYIGDFEEKATERGNYLAINLLGRINKCGVIKPRFAVKLDDYEKFEKRYLLAKDFGILIVSTSKGTMTHYMAKEKKIGGKLIAYCY